MNRNLDKQLSTYPERSEALQTEIFLFKKQLHEQERFLKQILNKLGKIEVGGEDHTSDPVKNGLGNNALFYKSLSLGIISI